MGDYVPPVMPLLEKHGIEVLVAQFGATAFEGSADSLIILRAESEAALRNFYNDPTTQARRHSAESITSDANWVLAPQFELSG